MVVCLKIHIYDNGLNGILSSKGQAGLLLHPNSTDATLVTTLHNLSTDKDADGHNLECYSHSVETADGQDDCESLFQILDGLKEMECVVGPRASTFRLARLFLSLGVSSLGAGAT
jgi:hypothetical protein